jgi:hypothetical protein
VNLCLRQSDQDRFRDTSFLSITGNITQFSHISHGLLSIPRPYIYLGFDQCKVTRSLNDGRLLKLSPLWSTLLTWEGHCKLHLVFICIFSYLSRWGARYDHGNSTVRWTLLDFAEDKLLCAECSKLPSLTNAQIYVVLSQRLALDTNTTNYLIHSLNPLHAVKSMHEQIANHMRVCVAIEDRIETLHGVAPSKPILSEAASRIMLTDKFSLHSVLLLVLDQSGRPWRVSSGLLHLGPRPSCQEHSPHSNTRAALPLFFSHQAFPTSIYQVEIQSNARQQAVASSP